MADSLIGSREWFEMKDLRRKALNTSVWIPLKASLQLIKKGEYGHVGYQDEYLGIGSFAVPVSERSAAESVRWSDLHWRHEPYVDGGQYFASEVEQYEGVNGLRLVIDQSGNSLERSQWHLHTDFVIALGLKREHNEWLAMNDGYEPVARIRFGPDGDPSLLEVKAEYLKDYLCARGMNLFVSSYRSRMSVVDDTAGLAWKEEVEELAHLEKWRAGIAPIREGGFLAEGAAVIHIRRTDVDPAEDVPVMGPPTDANIESESWTTEPSGRELSQVRGELWKAEWVEAGRTSPRVRGDEAPSSMTFVVDAAGTREAPEALVDQGRWLWFRPAVIPALLAVRGGALTWYTRDTGGVECSPGHRVHFGVNELGLVNVYAKDIALLPDWQRRIWAGYNITPEGRVSTELLASQVDAVPSASVSPESHFADALERLNAASIHRFGFEIVRDHHRKQELLLGVHRFRASDEDGLFGLAKDVARLTAESIDAGALQRIVPPPKGEKWGSLKSLEKVLASKMDPAAARRATGPLVGAYELRQSDAHLPTSDVADSLKLLRIKSTAPFPRQGEQLIGICVAALYEIAEAIETLWS